MPCPAHEKNSLYAPVDAYRLSFQREITVKLFFSIRNPRSCSRPSPGAFRFFPRCFPGAFSSGFYKEGGIPGGITDRYRDHWFSLLYNPPWILPQVLLSTLTLPLWTFSLKRSLTEQPALPDEAQAQAQAQLEAQAQEEAQEEAQEDLGLELPPDLCAPP